MRQHNISLVGKMGSGKTSIANWLEEYGYTRMPMAQAVREEAVERYGEWVRDKKHPDTRKILQHVGMEGRAKDPDYWVVENDKRIANVEGAVIVDDCRFINELANFMNKGWLIFFLDCPDEVRKERLLARDGQLNEKALTDVSETEMDLIRKLVKFLPVTLINSSQPLEKVKQEILRHKRWLGNVAA